MSTTLKTFGDYGGSGSKFFYWSQTHPRAVWMEPEVAEINPSRLSRMSIGGISAGGVEDSAYLAYESGTYAVGRLGRVCEGDSGAGLPKRDRAVVKALAQVGVSWTKMRESGVEIDRQFPLELGLLLPLEQFWKDADGLKTDIRAALSNFQFKGQDLSANVQKLVILPEGSGIYLSRSLQLVNQQKTAKDRMVIVLMFGHWQLSLLTFDRGNAPVESNSTSRGPGFIEYLQQCATEIPEMPYDSPLLFESVLEGQSEVLVPGRNEPINIEQAKRFAHRTYWTRVRDFLLKNLPTGDCDILIAGGAATWIHDELDDFLKERNQIERRIWALDLNPNLGSILVADDQKYSDPITLTRMLDAYSGFYWLVTPSAPKSKPAAARA